MIKDKRPFRVLIVEDNPGDLSIVEDFLGEQMTVPVIVTANSFKQASQILYDSDKLFDVILLDLTLPDKSGQPLINEMLQIASLCPIIILTGYSNIDFSIKSISWGILDYLLKDDLNTTTLYKSIIYAIERKKALTELKASEKRYSDLFYLSPQPMWVFDTDTYRFAQVNNATIMLYGYSEREFLNMTLMDLKLEEDIPKLKSNVAKSAVDDVFNGTVRHHKKSGELIEVEIYSTPILINDKKFISVIAIDITEKKQYEHKIIKAIIKTQEDERYEIGGELHDNVCQILSVSKLHLDMLKSSLAPTGVKTFDMCKDNITLALEEIRNLSHRLAPVFFDDSTMEEGFSRLLNNVNVEKKLKLVIHFNSEARSYPVSLDIQLNLYRILQEQLRNILKYANASVIELDVLIHKDTLKMRIADNGIGFHVNATKGGIGLANMKRRAELFSGKFELNSSVGNGCEIIVNIPLLKEN